MKLLHYKQADNTSLYFEIENACVTKLYFIKHGGIQGTPTCSCPNFKIKRTCSHMDMFDSLKGLSDSIPVFNNDFNSIVPPNQEAVFVDAGDGIKLLLPSENANVDSTNAFLGGIYCGSLSGTYSFVRQMAGAFSYGQGDIKKFARDVDANDVPVTFRKIRQSTVAFKVPQKPSDFYVRDDVWNACCYAAFNGKSVLLTGHSGSGKSELVYHVADAMGIDLTPINFGAMTEARISLIGATHLDKEKGTFFKESRFISAIRKDKGIVLMDEITRAPADAFNILLPALDGQGYVALDEAEDAGTVQVGAGVCFFATANVGAQYTGTSTMDEALRERFAVKVEVTFPPKEEEIKILVNRCGIDQTDASDLVGVAKEQRRLTQSGEFIREISTRMLIDTGDMVASGLPVSEAVKFSILNCFSAEGGAESDRAKVTQICVKRNLV